jgi:endonuclease YncB( thermonuclease family)
VSGRRRYAPDWPDYRARRGRGLRGLLALVALIVVAVAGSRFLPGGEAEPAPTSTVASPVKPGSAADVLAISERETGWYAVRPLEARAEATRVNVLDVIDGDTLDVLAAQTELRVRLYGVDTPERGERCYAEAQARSAQLLGTVVILVPDARQQDRGGRELRYVFTPEGRSVDATLIAEGVALAWREDGILRDQLVAIEERAQRERRGCLWAPG